MFQRLGRAVCRDKNLTTRRASGTFAAPAFWKSAIPCFLSVEVPSPRHNNLPIQNKDLAWSLSAARLNHTNASV